MASCDRAVPSDSESDSEGDYESDSETEEDEVDTRDRSPRDRTSRPTSAHVQGQPCRYYNSGNCRDGDNCRYLHLCKYALQGNCRNGSHCHLKHPGGGGASKQGAERRTTAAGKKLDDGRFYQWQLDAGNGWKDIANNHIIEAQYSLPCTKGIKIYNTPYGAVSIDFQKMRVRGKDLHVRRLDDGATVWLWFWSSSRGYTKYGDKGSKGNPACRQSSDIERKYQSNTAGSFTFNIGSDTVEIKFREMQQVSAQKKRKVTRRPQYRHPGKKSLMSHVRSLVNKVSLNTSAHGSSANWQFEGSGGNWYSFKDGSNMETKYQRDKNGSITITINGQSYKVDFRAMTQVNQSTGKRRKIRRI